MSFVECIERRKEREMGIVLHLRWCYGRVSIRNITHNFWFGLDYPEHVIHTGTGGRASLVTYDVFLIRGQYLHAYMYVVLPYYCGTEYSVLETGFGHNVCRCFDRSNGIDSVNSSGLKLTSLRQIVRMDLI